METKFKGESLEFIHYIVDLIFIFLNFHWVTWIYLSFQKVIDTSILGAWNKNNSGFVGCFSLDKDLYSSAEHST